jgi:hypothetical protein
VDQIQVDLLQAKPAKALFGLADRIVSPRMELGGHEHLVARNAAVAQGAADAFLVAVRLSGVDVAVSGVERPAYGVDAGGAVRTLPDTEAEHRHLIAVGQEPHVSGVCGRVDVHVHSILRLVCGEVSAT